MADEFNPDPWRRSSTYIDRTYPSGVARERPKLTTRIHCEPEREEVLPEAALSGPARDRAIERHLEIMGDAPEPDLGESAVDRFNWELRAGHGFRNEDEE